MTTPGTFVWLEARFEHDFPPPEVAAYMDQQGQMFMPDTVLAPAMRATIYVTATPYVGTADERGRFTFDNVVAGPYKAAGFADGKPIEKMIDVAGPRIDVTLH